MTALAAIGVVGAAAIALLIWSVRRLNRAAATPEPCSRCADREREREDLLSDLEDHRAAVQDLEASLQIVRQERDDALDVCVNPPSPSERADDLLARIGQLEVENAKLRTGGTVDQLLRERETSGRLAEEVHRLTQASVDRDRGM